MKRYFIIFAVFLFLLSACSSNIAQSEPTQNSKVDPLPISTEETDLQSTYPCEVERTQHYCIVEEMPFYYSYHIYNLNGEIVRSQSTNKKRPNISVLNDTLVEISIGYGTGLIGHTYYSINQNNFSEEFMYVYANNGQLIAYMDVPQEDPFNNRRIVVQDIFDQTIYYKEITLDFASIHTPVIGAEFIDDGSKLQITYLAGLDAVEQTTIVNI